MPRSRAAHLLGFFGPPSQMDHRLVFGVVFLTALVGDCWGAPQIASKTRLQQPVQVCKIPLIRVQLPIARPGSAIDAMSFCFPARLSTFTAQKNFMNCDRIVREEHTDLSSTSIVCVRVSRTLVRVNKPQWSRQCVCVCARKLPATMYRKRF